ncbi:MAG: methanogenesis marker 9 domain-containing protein [Methanotrichaceae archaeon]|nr:methanogenesis marker 9 domain-containing protein [Methanotrichaceae archaeon]
MLEVGYLDLKSPIAVISPYGKPCSNGSAGLFLIDDINLDKTSISEIESSLKGIDSKSAIGLSVSSSQDERLMDAARFASQNLFLLDLNFGRNRDWNRLLAVLPRIKRCGTTISARIRPEDLSADLFSKLCACEPDLIHLDLRGLNGMGPRFVKKVADIRGPKIMALGDVKDFDDAESLLAMGSDLVSLKGADPEFAEWLSQAMKEYDALSGWYNAPKHICSGGDLRGLAFCCPPVKHCPLLGALKKAGMSAEEFVERKLTLARGTPLEKGDGTCFGSLVWCCKITKPCYLRDAALSRAGLSGPEYMALKKKLAEDILKS